MDCSKSSFACLTIQKKINKTKKKNTQAAILKIFEKVFQIIFPTENFIFIFSQLILRLFVWLPLKVVLLFCTSSEICRLDFIGMFFCQPYFILECYQRWLHFLFHIFPSHSHRSKNDHNLDKKIKTTYCLR